MKVVFKSIITAAIAATCLFAGAGANAADFNPFTVVSPNGKTFTADKITGNYNEVVTFNQNGTFDVSMYFEAGQFVTNHGQTPLSGRKTGLNVYYGLYAVYKASGTVESSVGSTTYAFKPDTGGLNLFLDANLDTEVYAPQPATGAGDFTLAYTRDDVLLASGNTLPGAGTLTPNAAICDTFGIICAGFGSTASFNLTNEGRALFVEPESLYNISFRSGVSSTLDSTSTQFFNGSIDVMFNVNVNAVPEPASLGLLGLGLAGLGFARRRKQAR